MKTKNFILLCLLPFMSFGVVAQNVTIPDARFVTWLNNNYPSCMSGNQMDATCSGITSANSVNVI